METELFTHNTEEHRKDRREKQGEKRNTKNKVRERGTKPFAATDITQEERGAVSEGQTAAQRQPSCSRPSSFITFRADEQSDSTALTNP